MQQRPRDTANELIDRAMMARCVELSRIAIHKGEYPFGTVIARDGRIVAEAINRTVRERDVTRHAEVLALSQAQKTIGRQALHHYTLYTNIEPCAMCSYCIREAWIGRVVFALASPVMGGLTKWNILRDDDMSGRMAQVFDAAPEVVGGVLAQEAKQAWQDWSPLGWEMIRLRGLLTDACGHGNHVHVEPARERSLWHHVQALFERFAQARIEPSAVDLANREL
jgi:tRNA(adenine34) deaminase